jgi:phage terminase large subunit
MQLDLEINPIYKPYISTSYPLEIYYGGSSSGKSYFIEQKKLYKNITEPGHNYLFLRKSAIDVRSSVWALFKQVIYKHNLKSYVKLNESTMSARFFNNNRVICKGLDDVENLKSLTFESGPLTDIHGEEATQFTPEDYKQLELRLRGIAPVPKQIILSFNPISQLHWIKKRWFDHPELDTMILKSTYRDNKFLTDEDIKRIEKYKDQDPALYKIYGYGEWGDIGGLVFNNWEVKDFEYKESDMPISCGQDWGINDPAVCLKVGMHDQDIYIFDEFYRTGIRSNNELYNLEKSIFDGYSLICDNSEIKSIEDFKNFGANAEPAEKGKDSIIHGIKWISERKIYIKPHCINTIKEFQSYKWVMDKSGTQSDRPIDAFNHAIDALRYACERWQKESKTIIMVI